MTTNLRARFDGKVFIPVGEVDLPVGKEVELQVTSSESPPPGSPAAILEVISKPPHLSKEDADELERLIEEGKSPAREQGIFDDLK